MDMHARAPEPLTNVGNMARNWYSWKEDFIIFMKVTGYINKPTDVRANLLKNRIGKVGIDAIQNISFNNPQDTDNMDILIEKLEKYFDPPKNEAFERYQFFTKTRKQNETFEQHVNSLKEKAKTCNFKELTNSIIRDKIILDIKDNVLRKVFFETEDLDLQKIIMIYNSYNMNMEKMRQFTQDNQKTITKPEGCIQNPVTGNAKGIMKSGGACWRCNYQHPRGKCPAWGSKCTKCGDVNHFTQCCKGVLTNPKTNNKANMIPVVSKLPQVKNMPQLNNLKK